MTNWACLESDHANGAWLLALEHDMDDVQREHIKLLLEQKRFSEVEASCNAFIARARPSAVVYKLRALARSRFRTFPEPSANEPLPKGGSVTLAGRCRSPWHGLWRNPPVRNCGAGGNREVSLILWCNGVGRRLRVARRNHHRFVDSLGPRDGPSPDRRPGSPSRRSDHPAAVWSRGSLAQWEPVCRSSFRGRSRRGAAPRDGLQVPRSSFTENNVRPATARRSSSPHSGRAGTSSAVGAAKSRWIGAWIPWLSPSRRLIWSNFPAT